MAHHRFVARPTLPWYMESVFEDNFTASIRISFPFAGIGGPERALMEMKAPFVGVNVIDQRAVACHILRTMHNLADVTQCDIRRFPSTFLRDSDAIMGAAPCVTFSALGKLAGMDGDGKLFMIQLEWAREMHNRGVLKWVCFENVLAITFKYKHRVCALDEIQEWWRVNMSDFTPLRLYKLNATDCGLGQQRTRVFLVSFQKSFSHAVGGLPDQDTFPKRKGYLRDALLDIADCPPPPLHPH